MQSRADNVRELGKVHSEAGHRPSGSRPTYVYEPNRRQFSLSDS
ncbi:hypothetical protein BIFPSEUDO_02372 [Bifidobacterium pseudocatenulatum DSM 20438 = JCM 1200 = LMG 10505]|uniref:Uncharacterized protein n=1 Tax=Bifidobacterium pseudocatenulatum DSM 20438 = JCM 1200 = LMG 10505 TaxID=547043 RepID=C0BPT7_BIFPS|nr:hypothetical protein BIFPSEUDO_02372 [Bifidobacterium pseudocatenulatum DSM 20438 = JCM 1200 = LMG 10505]